MWLRRKNVCKKNVKTTPERIKEGIKKEIRSPGKYNRNQEGGRGKHDIPSLRKEDRLHPRQGTREEKTRRKMNLRKN